MVRIEQFVTQQDKNTLDRETEKKEKNNFLKNLPKSKQKAD